ncbi:MAG TPA: hypothetical protein DCY13_14585 [Verrucomicrobiales bacterium]|nr:hypothetical protein [Verrucomicrobiales bacterium]
MPERNFNASKPGKASRFLLGDTSAGVSMILGALVLFGWHTGQRSLLQISADFAPMQYNTALCFVLAGGGLLAALHQFPRVALGAGALLAAFAAITLAQYALSADFGIDQIFMRHYVTVESSHPGRFAPNTGVAFLLFGVGLMWTGWPWPVPGKTSFPALMGTVVIALGVVSLFGYLTGIRATYGWGQLTRMAVHTAGGFLVLGMGLLTWSWQARDLSNGVPPNWWPTALSLGAVTVALVVWQAMLALATATDAEQESGLRTLGGLSLGVGLLIALLAGWGASAARAVRVRATELQSVNRRLEREVEERKRAEAETSLSERQLSDAQSLARLGSWSWDLTSNQVTNSAELYRIYGLEVQPSGVHFNQFLDRTHPEDVGHVHQVINRAIKDHQPFQHDLRIVRPDGTVRALHSRGHVLTDVAGRATQMVGVCLDVTEERERQQELQASQARFQALFQSAPDAILVVDGRGRITLLNDQTEQLFGYGRDELIGRTVETLVPARFAAAHVKHRREYSDHSRLRAMGADLELSGRRKDGTEFPVDIMLSPLELNDQRFVIAIVRDITERREASDAIRRSLHEKELLIQEIHHRVKNNLQVISSLLNLQARRAPNAATRDSFREARQRVQAMALIHEKLNRSSDVSRIELAGYMESLLRMLFATYDMSSGRIRLVTEIDPIELSVDTAVPVGLIVNELVANALQHAFPSGQPGTITVEHRISPDGLHVLGIGDDGAGLRDMKIDGHAGSLGLRLVQILARQLDATLEMNNKNGTRYRLEFREPAKPKAG